jgi:DNA-binding protein H-NS
VTDLDFDAMNLDELKRLKRDLDKAIANFDQRRKAEAKREVEAKAKEYGYSLAELADTRGGIKTAVAPKYRNPNNPGQTWSGRGRQPVWYREAIEAGTEPDALAV